MGRRYDFARKTVILRYRYLSTILLFAMFRECEIDYVRVR